MGRNVTISWIEDDGAIIKPVVFRLERAGYEIQRYLTYSEAYDRRSADLAQQSNSAGSDHTRWSPRFQLH